MTAAEVQRATNPAAPACGERMMIAAGSYAESVCTVSFSDSPFSTADPAAFSVMRSALSRFAASSKEDCVRVEAS